MAKSVVCFWFASYLVSQQGWMQFLLLSVLLLCLISSSFSPLLDPSLPVFPNIPMSDLESLLLSKYLSSQVISSLNIIPTPFHKYRLMETAPSHQPSPLGLMYLMHYLPSDIPDLSAESTSILVYASTICIPVFTRL